MRFVELLDISQIF